MDIRKSAGVIKDEATLAELNAGLPVSKAEGGHNGFWALVSVENEKGDADGDIICIDGIQCDLDAQKGRFLPVLPGHKRSLPDGMPPEIGRIESLRKTTCNGMPALAMYFTFALDEKGNPIDGLVKSYYDRYRLGYSNAFSVGMKAMGEPERIDKTGGWRFKSTQLYEVSCVSIPANADALGLTRSKEDEDELLKIVKSLSAEEKAFFEKLSARMDEAFLAQFKVLENRLDAIESAIVSKADEPIQTNISSTPIDPAIFDGVKAILDRHAR